MKFNKSYCCSEEEESRFKTFASNLDELEVRRTMERSYSTGVTQFADLSQEEFRSFYLGGVKRPNPGILSSNSTGSVPKKEGAANLCRLEREGCCELCEEPGSVRKLLGFCHH